MSNLYRSLTAHIPASGDTVFLQLTDGRQVTYATFQDLTGALANRIANTGAKHGDRLMMQVDKSPEALAVYLAAVRAGLIFIPLNPAYGASELEYLVSDAKPSVVICDPDSPLANPDFVLPDGCVRMTLTAEGKGSLMEGPKDPNFNTVDNNDDDIAAILYTSGTTGKPKGAMLSHANLLSNTQALISSWHITGNDVLLHALPIFHTHGLFVATNTTLLAGARMIYLPRFDIDQVFDHLPEATTMMGVPTFYTRMLNDARLKRDICQHMRVFISGSAPLLAETHSAFEARTGHAILERYGMTETSMITSNPLDGERRAGTVGYALPGVSIRITDDQGTPLEDGQIGGVELTGPNVFKGYWQNPAKTNSEFRADGYFITGDIGQLEPDGRLSIVGRSKDLIISGGFNVYPKEVEEFIDGLHGVRESAVVGVPHPDFGEAVVAIVVASEASLSSDEIVSRGRTDLANFKAPKAALIVDALPRNAMGKVEKAKLRSTYSNLFITQGSD